MRINDSRPVSDNVEKNFENSCHAKLQNLYGQRTIRVQTKYAEKQKDPGG